MENTKKRLVDLINHRVTITQGLLEHSYKMHDYGSDEFIKIKMYELTDLIDRNLDIDVDYSHYEGVDYETGKLSIKPNFRFCFDRFQRNAYRLYALNSKRPMDHDFGLSIYDHGLEDRVEAMSGDGIYLVDFQEGETMGSYALFCTTKHLKINSKLKWVVKQFFDFTESTKEEYKKRMEHDDQVVSLIFEGHDQCTTASLGRISFDEDLDRAFQDLMSRVSLGKLIFRPW